MGVMAADALMSQGLELPQLSPETMEKLNSILSNRWSRGNPVDPGGDAFSYRCLWSLIEDENIDATMIIGSAGVAGSFLDWFTIPDSMRSELDQWMKTAEASELKDLERVKEMMNRYQKPIIISGMGIPLVRKGAVYESMEQNYLVPYVTPERAAKALAHLVEYSEYLAISK